MDNHRPEAVLYASLNVKHVKYHRRPVYLNACHVQIYESVHQQAVNVLQVIILKQI
jgi:hypothetical protein